jgi:hypothetical protein
MLFGTTQSIVMWVLWILFGAVKLWAFIDVMRQPAQAFPAVGRLSKVFWVLILGVAMLTGLLPNFTLGLIGIAGLIAALVYLFDVRPRIAELFGR